MKFKYIAHRDNHEVFECNLGYLRFTLEIALCYMSATFTGLSGNATIFCVKLAVKDAIDMLEAK